MESSEKVQNIELVYCPYSEITISTHQSVTEQAEIISSLLLKSCVKFDEITDFLSLLSLNLVTGLKERSQKLVTEAELINRTIEAITKHKIKT